MSTEAEQQRKETAELFGPETPAVPPDPEPPGEIPESDPPPELPADPELPGEPAEEPPKKKETLEERMQSLSHRTWELRESERKANEAAEKANAAADRLEQAHAKSGNPKPAEEDFESNAEYVEALADHKAQIKVDALEEKLKKQNIRTAEQSAEDETLRGWHAKRDKAAAKFTDFAQNEDMVQKVISHYQNAEGARQLSGALMGSPIAGELVQHLGKNTEKLEKIAQMSPFSAARELGAVEASLKKSPVPKITKAPAPITPVRGSGGAPTKDLSKMSTAEFMQSRNEASLRPRK